MSDYAMSATVIGADELKKAFDKSPEIAAKNLSLALNDTARTLRDKAADLAPYQSGNLKGSIHVQDSTPSKLEAVVGTDVIYARAQEFGYKRPGTKGLGIKAKFYMKRGKEATDPTFIKNLRDALDNIVTSLFNF